MRNFEQIEKGFFEIDAEDNSSYVGFYYANKDYFESININDEEIGQKILWILSQIILSAYKLKDYGLLKTILKPTIRNYKNYSIKYNYDLESDTYYKSLIYHVAIDNFDNNKYYFAAKYFNEAVHLDKDNFQLVDLYNESKYKLTKRIRRFLGITGLILLIISNFSIFILDVNRIDIIIFGYLGAILLLGYGTIGFILKQPSH